MPRPDLGNTAMTAKLQPFRIAVSDEEIADLNRRLAATRWPKAPAGPAWAMGASLAFMQKLTEHWRERYDWRAVEARLNACEQYLAPLDDQVVHLFVLRGSGTDPTPLLLTHGWPGSPIELLPLAERLAHPEQYGEACDQTFTVVIPSLPGVGFSKAPDRPTPPRHLARLYATLMQDRLGFARYLAHGGDWGAVITSWMAFDKAPGLAGVHLNTAVLQAAWSFESEPPGPEELAYLQAMETRLSGESAYQAVHATKPLSLAYGLADSPVGLAAWITEKFQGWTVEGPDLDPPFDLDHLISNVMFYWLGDAQAASWMYKFLVDRSAFLLPPGGRISLPCGFCLFPQDIAVPPPRSFLQRAYNVTHETRAEAGGHFPGLEHPDILAKDIRLFSRTL